MDFVTDLPKSTASGFTKILVVVDQLTKIAIFQPCQKDNDLPVLEPTFLKHVIYKHTGPNNIIPDHGTIYQPILDSSRLTDEY